MGQSWGATLDADFEQKKSLNFFWDSNRGQIDDFHLMRLFCLSIYIRNITYLTTVTQRIKKNTKKPLRSSKRTICCFGEGIQLNLLTLFPLSTILYGNQSGIKLANRLGLCSRSGFPVRAETASTCWVFTLNSFVLNLILAFFVVDSSSSGPEDFCDRCTA